MRFESKPLSFLDESWKINPGKSWIASAEAVLRAHHKGGIRNNFAKIWSGLRERYTFDPKRRITAHHGS